MRRIIEGGILLMPGFELVGQEELQAIREMFETGEGNLYRYGPKGHAVKELEARFAEYMGVRYAHAVSSGTGAIHSALAAVGVGPGDEVITTAFTFVAPVETICALGATPVPVEIDATYHLDPAAVEKAITPRTKAVVAIPMWAAPRMDELAAICEKHRLSLVEDAAQCLGGSYRGKKLGTIGRIGSFSFDMGKSITTGEGGMIITDDEELYKRAAEFADHGHMHEPGLPRGQDPRRAPGLNYRMNEVTGAVGLAQLAKLDYLLDKQKENKKRVKEAVINLPGLKFREFADEAGSQGDTLIFSLPSEAQASEMARLLAQEGIGSKILPEAFDWHYAGAWTHIFRKFPGYDLDHLENHWPKTGHLLKSSIALFIYVKMDEERITKLTKAIRKTAAQVTK